MRPLNTLASIALATFLVVGLSACGKKKNGSSGGSAATPGSACVWNAQLNTYTNSAGQLCTPTNQTIICPATGIYTNQQGQQLTCTPGQQVNVGGYGYPGNYQYPNYQNQTGCDQYYYQYGIQYVPVVLGGQLQCMRIDLVNQGAQGSSYYNNYDYYFAYPPYEYNPAYQSCSFGFAFSGFSLCFGN